MYSGKKVGVIVPAHNEEEFIASVIRSMPAFVDKIYVVNDASKDRTAEIVSGEKNVDKRLLLINRDRQGGVGAAIMTGHGVALQDGMDVLAVMAGDGQMDPVFLEKIIRPVVENTADYAKGNRLSNGSDRRDMPPWRLFGNILLTQLTRVASGYWSISDPQNGYTAVSAKTLLKLDLKRIERGFAFENDMLVKLHAVGARVIDVPHSALYSGQHSKIRYYRFIVRTSWVLLKNTVWRLWNKYVRGVPHPLKASTKEITQR